MFIQRMLLGLSLWGAVLINAADGQRTRFPRVPKSEQSPVPSTKLPAWGGSSFGSDIPSVTYPPRDGLPETTFPAPDFDPYASPELSPSFNNSPALPPKVRGILRDSSTMGCWTRLLYGIERLIPTKSKTSWRTVFLQRASMALDAVARISI